MLTALALALALTALALPQAHALQKFKQRYGRGYGSGYWLTSVSATSDAGPVSFTSETAHLGKPEQYEWEFTDGQLRTRSGLCAFPGQTPKDTSEHLPGPNEQNYDVLVYMYPCKQGRYNHWSREGGFIKWREFCLENTGGQLQMPDAEELTNSNYCQLWNCSYEFRYSQQTWLAVDVD